MRELEARSDKLERRIDQVEADREAAEWRIHNNTEAMLDGLLRDVRAIADRLTDVDGTSPGPWACSPGRHPVRARSRRRVAAYSVEMLGSAWTLWGTTMRKFSGALAASSRIRTASSPWSVAFSSSA